MDIKIYSFFNKKATTYKRMLLEKALEGGRQMETQSS